MIYNSSWYSSVIPILIAYREKTSRCQRQDATVAFVVLATYRKESRNCLAAIAILVAIAILIAYSKETSKCCHRDATITIAVIVTYCKEVRTVAIAVLLPIAKRVPTASLCQPCHLCCTYHILQKSDKTSFVELQLLPLP